MPDKNLLDRLFDDLLFQTQRGKINHEQLERGVRYEQFEQVKTWQSKYGYKFSIYGNDHLIQTLSYLYDTKLIDAVRQSNGQDTTKILDNNGMTVYQLTYFVLWTSVSGLIGLLAAFIVSLTISIKRHWFWINALIAFILTYILYRFDLLAWTYLKQFFEYFGQKFNNSTIIFLFNGIMLLTIGLLIFFLRRTNQFIENNKMATE